MKKKTTAVLLSLMLCVTLFPAEVFAWTETDNVDTDPVVQNELQEDIAGNEDQVPDAETLPGEVNADNEDSSIDNNGSDETADANEEQPEEEPVNKAKAFKQNGMNLSFKKNVLIDIPLESVSAPARTQITGKKKSMKVTWTAAKSAASIDGYIILRKTGKNKVYKQVAAVSRSKTSYTDKKAKKKNTEYAYTVVGYRKAGSDIRVSSCAAWASGLTTKSKLKNGYKAKISKKSVKLQYGDGVKLTLKYSNAKKIHKKTSFRWYSDNTAVAKVSSKGVVTAKGTGTAVITGRLASGRDYTCSVKVIGAYKPAAPALETESATTDSITLEWGKVTHATSYELFRSEDGGETYGDPVSVKSNLYTDTGLQEGQEYSYYIQARNDNGEYTAVSEKSAVHKQKAVLTPHKTKLTGFPTNKSIKARKHLKETVTVTAPAGRKAYLQMKEDGKWKNKKTITLPEGYKAAKVTIKFPDSWWNENKTVWRLSIPKSTDSTALTSSKLTVKTQRYYQNPKGYVQITNKISKHGYSYYTSPVLVNNTSTRKDHVEAMIKTAYKYKGDPYANRWSRAPGSGGVDCSGLVMQACYGAGVDLWPSNPHRHRYGAARYEWESREIARMSNLKTVSYGNRKRGDLIFFCNSSGTVIHVAIYLGGDKIIHSTTVGGHVIVSGMGGGAFGRICKVKRVFIS